MADVPYLLGKNKMSNFSDMKLGELVDLLEDAKLDSVIPELLAGMKRNQKIQALIAEMHACNGDIASMQAHNSYSSSQYTEEAFLSVVNRLKEIAEEIKTA